MRHLALLGTFLLLTACTMVSVDSRKADLKFRPHLKLVDRVWIQRQKHFMIPVNAKLVVAVQHPQAMQLPVDLTLNLRSNHVISSLGTPLKSHPDSGAVESSAVSEMNDRSEAMMHAAQFDGHRADADLKHHAHVFTAEYTEGDAEGDERDEDKQRMNAEAEEAGAYRQENKYQKAVNQQSLAHTESIQVLDRKFMADANAELTAQVEHARLMTLENTFKYRFAEVVSTQGVSTDALLGFAKSQDAAFLFLFKPKWSPKMMTQKIRGAASYTVLLYAVHQEKLVDVADFSISPGLLPTPANLSTDPNQLLAKGLPYLIQAYAALH